jgi:hypothetical protein
MNTLYLLSRGRARYVPDEPLPKRLAEALQREWTGVITTTILGQPVTIVDLRPPEATVDVVELDPPPRDNRIPPPPKERD